MNKFAHVYPAMVTPFNQDGSFNYETAKKHADWMINEGISGVGILMAAGEYQSMTLEEHKEYVREMVPYVKEHGASVIVGCTRERPEDVVELMENAREAGADGAMVLPSFYYRMDQKELVEHYKYINDHSGLDIMVYNNPHSSTPISTETMEELYKLEHVKMVKDASMTIDIMTDYIFAANKTEDVSVLCGCDYLLYQAYATGATGWVSMTANILPKLSAEFHKAMIVEKDFEKGLELFKKLYPVVNMTERFPKPTQAVKYILEEVYGFEEGICRRPRLGLSGEEKKHVLESSNIVELSKESSNILALSKE
ncbi:dihydrodipicolinate synthase family protein [Priestia filamentosa]|uniref:dihydrodipicolinate synthase family protein n=1 Tax=Priestia filamentosa TaxID=1402861 RepID=UPI002E1A10B3|nr:dihydrodipicolinate synthase family protein [Priestia filamentosa]